MRKLLQALSLGVALILASCSQDKGEEPIGSQDAKTVNVHVAIEAELEDDALRSSVRSLSATFNEGNNWRPEIAELKPGDKVSLNLVFSNGGPLSHHTVEFTVDANKKLVFKGDIPVSNYSLNTDWYVTAIYGGAKTGEMYGYAPQMYKIGSNESKIIGADFGGLNIPYMSGWTKVKGTYNSAKNRTESFFSVKLRPLGYLLRVNIVNRRDHKISAMKFEPNASQADKFFTNTNFSLSTTPESLQSGAYPIPNLRQGNIDEGNGRLIEAGAGVELGRGDGAETKAGTFLLWIMPKEKITAPTTLTLDLLHYKQGSEWRFPFQITLQPGEEIGLGGVSGLKTLIIPNDHKIYRKLYDLDYVAKGNMANDGTELAEGVAGYSDTWENYNKNFRAINARRYGTDMTTNNWKSILPQESNLGISRSDYDGGGSADGWRYFDGRTGEPDKPRAGAANNRDGEYYRSLVAGKRVVYAVRSWAWNTSGHPGKKAAYRYELESNGTLTIDMVHLDGAYNNTQAINTVAQEAYWSTAREYGEVIRRIFPGGQAHDYSKFGVQSSTYYYVALRTGSTGASILWNYINSGSGDGGGRVGIDLDVTSSTNRTAKRQVRLIKDKPLDLDVNP